MEKRLPMAPCGIDCNACNLYRAPFDAESAASLVSWFRSMGWIEPDGGAAEVVAKGPFCVGCLGECGVQWSGNCEIKSCCVDGEKLAHCGECPDFICEKLALWGEWLPHHAKAIENLTELRKAHNA